MKGLPRHELEASIQQIFRAADGDDSGALDRDEFVRCLEESGMGFTRRERNLILSELPTRFACPNRGMTPTPRLQRLRLHFHLRMDTRHEMHTSEDREEGGIIEHSWVDNHLRTDR